jgi:hypothetical protein
MERVKGSNHRTSRILHTSPSIGATPCVLYLKKRRHFCSKRTPCRSSDPFALISKVSKPLSGPDGQTYRKERRSEFDVCGTSGNASRGLSNLSIRLTSTTVLTSIILSIILRPLVTQVIDYHAYGWAGIRTLVLVKEHTLSKRA